MAVDQERTVAAQFMEQWLLEAKNVKSRESISMVFNVRLLLEWRKKQ
ncbi:hypothetical protein SNF32_09475 [Enterococcus mundtii]|nr:hypothetical protein [Enterococcus mundtii]